MKRRKGFAESIMMQTIGITNTGLSSTNRNSMKVKKFNPERLLKASNYIVADTYRPQAEAAEVLKRINTLKGRGFSEAEIVDKVKSVGKDVWTTIKKLIGMLKVVLEESLASLFDKSKKLDDIGDKFSELSRKFLNLGATEKIEINGHDQLYIDLAKVKKDEMTSILQKTEYVKHSTVTVPKGKKNKTVDAYIKKTTRAQGVKDPDSVEEIMNLLRTNAAITADSDFWASRISQKTNNKAQREIFRELKKNAKSIVKSGNAPGNINLSKISGKIPAAFEDMINVGLALESKKNEYRVLNNHYKNFVKGYKEAKKDIDEFTISAKDLGYVCQILAEVLKKFYEKAQTSKTSYGKVKKILVSISNLPQSTVGGTEPSVLQVVRDMCKRAYAGITANRTALNSGINTMIVVFSGMYKEMNDGFEQYKSDNDYKDNSYLGKINNIR